MSKPISTPTRPFRYLWPEPVKDPRLVKLCRAYARSETLYEDARWAMAGPNKERLIRHRERRFSRISRELSDVFLKLDVGQWVQVDRVVYFRRSGGQHVGMRTVRSDATKGG